MDGNISKEEDPWSSSALHVTLLHHYYGQSVSCLFPLDDDSFHQGRFIAGQLYVINGGGRGLSILSICTYTSITVEEEGVTRKMLGNPS